MNSSSQKRIVDHYAKTGETQAINLSIDQAKRHPYRTPSMQFQRYLAMLFSISFISYSLRKHIRKG